MTWKVKFRKTCLICGEPIKVKRFRTFCSKKCRQRHYNKKYQPKSAAWLRDKNDKAALVPSSDKKKCGICGRWYVQVGTHIVQRHGMTAREYRKEMNLPLRKGIMPDWYRKLKREQALDNPAALKNLKIGKKFHYKKNDPRTKVKYAWRGTRAKYRKPDDLY